MAPDCVLAIRHAALGARRRLTRAGVGWRRAPSGPGAGHTVALAKAGILWDVMSQRAA